MTVSSSATIDLDDRAEIQEPADDGDAVAADAESEPSAKSRLRRPMSAPRRATLFGLCVVLALTGLAGWWGWRLHQSQQTQAQRSHYLQVAKQGALNLTTINWQHADADVRRILDGATGQFHDDFAKRSQPFVEVLQQAKAVTVGTVTEAALESETPDGAQALVLVSVRTSNAGEPDPVPRAWRMRINVQRVGTDIKVSNVGFVQ